VRVAVLWAQLSGYINTCFKALAETEQVDLFVANMRVTKDAPFDESIFSWIENRYQWEIEVDEVELISRLERFKPDVILASNWHNSGYRKVFKCFEGRAIRIFSMDNQWLGSPKQWLGIFISRFYLHPICDAVFVAGERQAVFAHKLGFSQGRILRGVYSCDHDKFAKIHFERNKSLSDPQSFIFVGRFSPEKGVDVLVDAYCRYRETASDPWPLKCYGNGPLQNLMQGVEGIKCKGFCQPDDLPKEFSMASCLLLPSIFEPWAVVVHEAAATGMPVIVSDAVGATVHLVQDGYNGYVVETGNVEELMQAMLRISSMSQKERSIMGDNSYLMSLQFTPKRWANTLVRMARELAENQ
jgi:glycosyltransferase involved in cell wall biosynthesis